MGRMKAKMVTVVIKSHKTCLSSQDHQRLKRTKNHSKKKNLLCGRLQNRPMEWTSTKMMNLYRTQAQRVFPSAGERFFFIRNNPKSNELIAQENRATCPTWTRRNNKATEAWFSKCVLPELAFYSQTASSKQYMRRLLKEIKLHSRF